MLGSVIYSLTLICFIGLGGCDSYIVTPPDPIDSSKWGDSLAKIWQVQKLTPYRNSPVRTTPYIRGDNIIFGYDTLIECLNKNTGTRVWAVGFGKYWNNNQKPFWEAIEFVVEGDRLYALLGESKLVCLNIGTGYVYWIYDVGQYNDNVGRGFSRYSFSPSAIYLTTYTRHELICVSKSDGKEILKCRIPFPSHYDPGGSFPGPPTFINKKIYIGYRGWPGTSSHTHDGGLICMDANTGDSLWVNTFPSVDSNIGFSYWRDIHRRDNETVLIPFDGSLLFITAYTIMRVDLNGQILWEKVAELGESVENMNGMFPPLLYDGLLYGYNNSWPFAFCLDPQNGAFRWREVTTEKQGSIHTVQANSTVINSNSIYKVTDGNWLICQELTTGVVTWATYLTTLANDYPTGGFAVEGKRIYFFGYESIFCFERVN